MKTPVSRRHFLTRASLGIAAGAVLANSPLGVAIGPFHRTGPARIKLSLAAYSLRGSMIDRRNPIQRPRPRQITMFEFIDYCAELGIPGAELTSYYFEETSDEYFLNLKRHAFLKGITVSGTAIGNNFCLPGGEERDRQIQNTKDWIDRAQLLGAPHIRIFAGDRGQLEHDEAKRLCITAIEECCDYAGTKGIFLGIENHGGIVAEADDLLDIVKAVDSPWFGINLDTENFRTDDPWRDLTKCAPYAVNVQLKVELQYRGQPKIKTDIPRIVQILKDANYQGFLALEHEANEDPRETIPGYLKEIEAAIRE